MGRVLAFDYGTKRVGVAVTDTLQIIANTLPTVDTPKILEFVKNYCNKEDVEAFAVGYPVVQGHQGNPVVKQVDTFVTELKKLFPSKQVHLINETFTSCIAAQTLLMSGVNKKERKNKGHIDAISANLILQTYLEMKQNNLLQ